jgi:hypothetical protein
VLSRNLDQSWARRKKAAIEYNSKLASAEIKPGLWMRAKWSVKALRGGKGSYGDRKQAMEMKWREVDGLKEPSLAWALNDVFGLSFWLAGIFKASCAHTSIPKKCPFLTLNPGLRRYFSAHDSYPHPGSYSANL